MNQPQPGEIIDGYEFLGGDPADPAAWKQADAQGPAPMPQPGEVVDGFEFLGGDPADQASWKPVSSPAADQGADLSTAAVETAVPVDPMATWDNPDIPKPGEAYPMRGRDSEWKGLLGEFLGREISPSEVLAPAVKQGVGAAANLVPSLAPQTAAAQQGTGLVADATDSTAKNIAAGTVERTAQLGGNALRALGTLIDSVGMTETEKLINRGLQGVGLPPVLNSAETLRQMGGDVAETKTGYQPEYTLDRMLEDPSLETVPGFMLEQGVTSIPDMLAAVFVPEVYILARGEELGAARAEANNRDQPNMDDKAVGYLAAPLVALLDRMGAHGIMQAGTRELAKVPLEALKAGGKEAATEAGQENIEYAAESVGTKQGWDPEVATKRTIGGVTAGGGTGASLGGLKAGAEAMQGRRMSDLDKELEQANFAGGEKRAQGAILGDMLQRAVDEGSLQPKRETVRGAPVEDAGPRAATPAAPIPETPIPETPIPEAPAAPTPEAPATEKPATDPATIDLMAVYGMPEEDLRALAREFGVEGADAAKFNRLAEKTIQAVAKARGFGMGSSPRPSRVRAQDMEVDTELEMVPLASLITSDSEHYDQRLQPRDRSRATSDEQIRRIAQDLDPRQLVDSPTADTGAPIIGPDGMVESGNGRVMALRRAMQEHPEQYQKYLAELKAQGFHGDNVVHPILVRRRKTDLDEKGRIDFVNKANTANIAAMSATEQAQSDSRFITEKTLGAYQRGADLTSVANQEFVQGFLAQVPASQRGDFIGPDNRLSQGGAARIRQAMLAAAFPDPETLARITESTDDNVRSISNAMVAASPAFLGLRRAIDAGRVRKDMDITEQLVKAAKIVSDARSKKQHIREVLDQGDMFGGGDPVVDSLIRAFYNPDLSRALGADKIAGFLEQYAEQAQRQTTDQNLFGEDTEVSAADTLNALLAKRGAETAPKQTGMFGTAADLALEPVTGQGRKSAAPDGAVADAAETETDTLGEDGRPITSVRSVAFTNRRSFANDIAGAVGMTPEQFLNLPAERQYTLAARALRETFGVRVEREKGPNRLDSGRAVDQMRDAYRNLHFMARALGLPPKAIGLDGTLVVLLQKKSHALGWYRPGTRQIGLPARSNSFAHEWAHALDHYLMSKLGGEELELLSRAVSGDQGFPQPKLPGMGGKGDLPFDPGAKLTDVEGAFVHLMQSIFQDKARQAYEVMQIQGKLAAAEDPALIAKLEKQLAAAQANMEGNRAQSDYFKRAASFGYKTGNPGYWLDPTEMLARAFESYIARQVEIQGGTTEFVSKSDAAYRSLDDIRLRDAYPKDNTRGAIFAAFDKVFGFFAEAEVLGKGPAAVKPTDPMMDPLALERLAGVELDPEDIRGLKKLVRDTKDAAREAVDTLRNPGRPRDAKAISARLRDGYGLALTSMKGLIEVQINRYRREGNEKAARAMERVAVKLMNIPGAGKSRADNYEHVVNRLTGRYTNRLGTAISPLGKPGKWTDEAKAHLRSALLGDTKGVPAEIQKVAADIREHIFRDLYYYLRDAGLDLGYVEKSGYLPRIEDRAAILADGAGFRKAAAEVYNLVFDRDVDENGSLDFANFIEKAYWAGLRPSKNANSGFFSPALKQLRKGLREIEAARAEGKPEAEIQEMERALQEWVRSSGLYNQVRDRWSKERAQHWHDASILGADEDFDTRGPQGDFTKGRVLPAETDRIMEKFYVSDPLELSAMYINRAVRRAEFVRRFKEDVDQRRAVEMNDTQPRGDLTFAVTKRNLQEAGVHDEDIKNLVRFAETITGRARTGLPQYAQSTAAAIHTVGTLSLLDRAVFASLMEPVATTLQTGSVGLGLKHLGASFAAATKGAIRHAGGWVGASGPKVTDAERHRKQLAQYLGIVQNTWGRSVTMERFGGTYEGDPRWTKMLDNMFTNTFLVGLTNVQRETAIGIGHAYAHNLAKAYLGQEGVGAAEAKMAGEELVELGVSENHLKEFAEWMVERDPNVLPTVDEVHNNFFGKMLGTVLYEYADLTIQNPKVADRPYFANNPAGRLVYGITSFAYAFWENVVLRQARLIARAKETGDRGLYSRMIATRAVQGALVLVAAQSMSAMLRDALFNPDKYEDADEWEKLGGRLLTGLLQSNLGGPVATTLGNVFTGLRYERDLTAITAGPQLGYFLQSLQRATQVFLRNSENTNTAEYRSVEGLYQLVAVPAIATVVGLAPGGSFIGSAAGIASWWGTSKVGRQAFADAVVGEKGSPTGDKAGKMPTPPKLPGPPKLPDLPGL